MPSTHPGYLWGLVTPQAEVRALPLVSRGLAEYQEPMVITDPQRSLPSDTSRESRIQHLLQGAQRNMVRVRLVWMPFYSVIVQSVMPGWGHKITATSRRGAGFY